MKVDKSETILKLEPSLLRLENTPGCLFPSQSWPFMFPLSADFIIKLSLKYFPPTVVAFFGMASLHNQKSDVAWYFMVGVESRRILRNLCKWAVGTGLSLPLNSKTFTIKLNKIYFKQTFSIKLNKVNCQ